MRKLPTCWPLPKKPHAGACAVPVTTSQRLLAPIWIKRRDEVSRGLPVVAGFKGDAVAARRCAAPPEALPAVPDGAKAAAEAQPGDGATGSSPGDARSEGTPVA